MTDWTDDMIVRLRALWDEGHKTVEIGRALGVSKDAICGKVHRLNLPPRVGQRNGQVAAPRPRIIRPHRAVSTLPALASAAEARRIAAAAKPRLTQIQFSALGRAPAKPPELTMEQLRLALAPVRSSSPHRKCQWVTNEGRPYQFCGKPSTYRVCDDGVTLHWYAWCFEHKQRVYVRPVVATARAA